MLEYLGTFSVMTPGLLTGGGGGREGGRRSRASLLDPDPDSNADPEQ